MQNPLSYRSPGTVWLDVTTSWHNHDGAMNGTMRVEQSYFRELRQIMPGTLRLCRYHAPRRQFVAVATLPAAAATNLPDGLFLTTIQITNLNTTYAQSVAVELSVGLIQNGGFETGDFTDWTLVGNTNNSTNVFNEVVGVNSLSGDSGAEYIHSGDYGAFLGDTNLATLSQSFETTPGQSLIIPSAAPDSSSQRAGLTMGPSSRYFPRSIRRLGRGRTSWRWSVPAAPTPPFNLPPRIRRAASVWMTYP